MNNTLRTVLIVVVLCILGYLLLPYVNMDENTNNPQNQGANTQNQTNDPLAGKEEGTRLYISQNHGVRFTYDPTPAEGFNIVVTEQDNKIYVHGQNETPEQGQWIEVFSKDPNISVEDAIRSQFLQNIDPKNCYPRVYEGTEQDRLNYVAAGISYPPPTDSTQPFWQNSDKCPAGYSETNAVQYFLMNKDLPGKFLFVKIGQDSITSDGTPRGQDGSGYNWTHSIEII